MKPKKQENPPQVVSPDDVPGLVRGILSQGILVVEDDPDVRKVTREVLESSGYRTWEAADGLEALNLWRVHASKIDLLLVDIVLPGRLNGWELSARLRKERRDLKVVMISSLAVDQEKKNQFRDFILPKPFSLECLTETVRQSLDRAPRAD